MPTTKVWILTTGVYSDKSNRGVFSSPEECQKVIDGFPDEGWNEPEEFVLDELVSKANSGKVRFMIFRNREGVDRVYRSLPTDYYDYIGITSNEFSYQEYGSVHTDTEERALKIFSEKVAMMKSEGLTSYHW